MKRLLMPAGALAVIATTCLVGAAFAGQPNRPGSAQSQIDRIAESYVKLVLAVGQYDSEYVDSYSGPPEWQEQAAARRIPLGDLH